MNAIDAPEHGAGWYAVTRGAADEPHALSADLDADICIIGGGLAGLTAARDLARRDWSVVVLEAGLVGADWSGQGIGIVTPGFPERPERIAERVGLDAAKELWRLTLAGLDQVRGAIDENAMAGVLPVSGQLCVQYEDDAERCRRRVDLLCGAFETEAEMWPAERVRAVLRSAMHHQAIYLPTAFHIDPLAYVVGLSAQARRAGARIYERTPALAIDAEGVRKRVQTPTGRVRARHVVLAASDDAGRLCPPLAGTVIPLARHLAITAPLGETLATAVNFAGAVTSQDAGSSHRVVGGERLLWAGSLTTGRSSSRRLADHMRRQIARTYPQLRGATVEHAWSVQADYAVHRMPQIGELSPGLWLAGAFGHHGIATAAMAGDLIARAIHGGDDRWRLFQPFGLVWGGGGIGRAAIAMALSALRARTRLRALFARGRLEPLPTDAPVHHAASVAASVEAVSPMPPAVAATPPQAPTQQRRTRRPTAETDQADGAKRRTKPVSATDKRLRELPKPADVLAGTAERGRRPRPRKEIAAPALAAQNAPDRAPAKGDGADS